MATFEKTRRVVEVQLRISEHFGIMGDGLALEMAILLVIYNYKRLPL